MRKKLSRAMVCMLCVMLGLLAAIGLSACATQHTKHTPGTAWVSDDTNHWHVCTECDKKLDVAAHDFTLKSDGDHHWLYCDVCGKQTDVEDHTLQMVNDETEHWYECTEEGCDFATSPVAHSMVVVTDGEDGHHTECSADDCDYATEVTDHVNDDVVHYDDNEHYNLCTACGEKLNTHSHTRVTVSEADGHYEKCSAEGCEYRTGKENHTSADGRYRTTADGIHYQTCDDCGARFNEAGHEAEDEYTIEGTLQEGRHYKKCKVCKIELADTIGTHTVEYTQDEANVNHYQWCPICGLEGEKEAHTLAEGGSYSIKNNRHNYTCGVCELAVSAAHAYEEGAAECKVCGNVNYTFTEVKEDGEVTAYLISTIKAGAQLHPDYPEGTLVLPSTYNGIPVIGIADASAQNKSAFNDASLSVIDTVVIPEGYTTIGEYAFYNSNHRNLANIYIPSTITKIAENAFRKNASGGTVSQNVENVYLANIDNWFNVELAHSVSAPWNNTNTDSTPANIYIGKYGDEEKTLLTEVVVPETVTELKSYLFAGGATIQSVKLHKHITSIGTSTFSGCVGLAKVDIEDIDAYYNNVTIASATSGPFNAGHAKIYNNGELVEDFPMPEGATTVKAFMFYGATVKNITIPETLTTMTASSLCLYVDNIYVSSLASYLALTTASNKKVVEGGEGNLFVNGEKLTELKITDENLAAWGISALNYGFSYIGSITSVEFDSKMTDVATSAFEGCFNLSTIKFTKGITSIKGKAFADCTGLKGTLDLSESGITTLTTRCFMGCTGLDTIILPAALKTSSSPFSGVSDHTRIVFPKNTQYVAAAKAFWGSSSSAAYQGKTIVLPKITSLGADTFKYTTNIKFIYYLGNESEWASVLGLVAANSGNDVLAKATVVFYSEEDPGEGNRAGKWHYDTNGLPVMWDTAISLFFNNEFIELVVSGQKPAEGWTMQLAANSYTEGAEILYSTEEEGITVTPEGLVTANKLGTYTVKAYLKDNPEVYVTAHIMVCADINVTGVSGSFSFLKGNPTNYPEMTMFGDGTDGTNRHFTRDVNIDKDSEFFIMFGGNRTNIITNVIFADDIKDKFELTSDNYWKALEDVVVTVTVDLTGNDGGRVYISAVADYSKTIKVLITGRNTDFDKFGILKTCDVTITPTSGYQQVVFILTAQDVAANLSYPNVQLAVDLGDENILYLSTMNETAYYGDFTGGSSNKWHGYESLWYDGNYSGKSTTFTITIDAVGRITECVITQTVSTDVEGLVVPETDPAE